MGNSRRMETDGALYDPCCGSGGMFIQCAKQIATIAREKLKTLCPALVQRAAHS